VSPLPWLSRVPPLANGLEGPAACSPSIPLYASFLIALHLLLFSIFGPPTFLSPLSAASFFPQLDNGTGLNFSSPLGSPHYRPPFISSGPRASTHSPLRSRLRFRPRAGCIVSPGLLHESPVAHEPDLAFPSRARELLLLPFFWLPLY